MKFTPSFIKTKFSSNLMSFLRALGRREQGQSLVEYVLIIALVSIVMVVALNQLGAAIVNVPIAAVVAAL